MGTLTKLAQYNTDCLRYRHYNKITIQKGKFMQKNLLLCLMLLTTNVITGYGNHQDTFQEITVQNSSNEPVIFNFTVACTSKPVGMYGILVSAQETSVIELPKFTWVDKVRVEVVYAPNTPPAIKYVDVIREGVATKMSIYIPNQPSQYFNVPQTTATVKITSTLEGNINISVTAT